MFHAKIKQYLSSEESKYVLFKHQSSKVVCVGRNYLEHALELDNPVPKTPLLFIKSTNTLAHLHNKIEIPESSGKCHHELEVAILIETELKKVTELQALDAIYAIGVGLDLTLRDLQTQLKEKGQPWEKAKSFDGACPVSEFVEFKSLLESEAELKNYFTNLNEAKKAYLNSIDFTLLKNQTMVQKGNTKDMIFKVPFLISEISKHFTLYPGDIILTGTPEGVGNLEHHDQLSLTLNGIELGSAQVISN